MWLRWHRTKNMIIDNDEANGLNTANCNHLHSSTNYQILCTRIKCVHTELNDSHIPMRRIQSRCETRHGMPMIKLSAPIKFQCCAIINLQVHYYYVASPHRIASAKTGTNKNTKNIKLAGAVSHGINLVIPKAVTGYLFSVLALIWANTIHTQTHWPCMRAKCPSTICFWFVVIVVVLLCVVLSFIRRMFACRNLFKYHIDDSGDAHVKNCQHRGWTFFFCFFYIFAPTDRNGSVIFARRRSRNMKRVTKNPLVKRPPPCAHAIFQRNIRKTRFGIVECTRHSFTLPFMRNILRLMTPAFSA